MIKKIEIKDIASYSPEGEEIPDLKKVNFFFGNNGSGKSTITKFLYNLNLQKDLSETRYKNCTTEGFNDQTHQILVFDDQFVERNFINKNFQPGIFSLNEKNDEIDILINAEKEKLKIDENHFNSVLPSREKKLKDLLHKSTEELKKTCFKERKAFDTFYQHDIKSVSYTHLRAH
uniref:AAA family ATPase n=1 Tax=Marivirga sp. TaxID=2018662 RepID=UPI0025DA4D27